jgi:hypothetical protein
MACEIQITRDGGIPIEEWKNVVALRSGLRCDNSPSIALNPKTGERIVVDANDGDVAMEIDGSWAKVFHFLAGRVKFKAGLVNLKDPDDSIAQTAFALAETLQARVVDEDGNEHRPCDSGEK